MEKTKEILEKGNYTCVLSKDDIVITSNERGVKPLVALVEQNADVKDFFAADKVVGKAAAFLYVILGVKQVYARVISKHALSVFERYKIKVSYDILTDAISNRTGDGFCPMETAVLDADSPSAALDLIKNKLKELKK